MSTMIAGPMKVVDAKGSRTQNGKGSQKHTSRDCKWGVLDERSMIDSEALRCRTMRCTCAAAAAAATME